MRKQRIIYDFLRAGNAQLETQSGAIIAAMTNNQYFTTPMPTLGEVNTAQQQYVAALRASQGRDTYHIQQRRDARRKLELELTRLANYVMVIAGDNRAIMVSSGFTVTSETRSTTSLGPVQNFSVTLGANSGEVLMKVKPVRNKESYVFMYALAEGDTIVWVQVTKPLASFLVTGLQPLKTYLFKIHVVGNKNQSAETEVITKVVL